MWIAQKDKSSARIMLVVKLVFIRDIKIALRTSKAPKNLAIRADLVDSTWSSKRNEVGTVVVFLRK